MWHGPNAANISTQASLDYVIGIVDAFYVDHVRDRLTYVTPDERAAVIGDMTNLDRSVLQRLLAELGLTNEEVAAMDLAHVLGHLETRPDLTPLLNAFHHFERSAGSASAAHYGLIITYLIKSENRDDTDQRGHPAPPKRAVDAGHGTGGRTHTQTEEVMRMRNRHPVARKLSVAANLAGRARTPERLV